MISDSEHDAIIDERNAAEAKATRALQIVRALRARYQRRLREEQVRVDTYKQALQCLFAATADAIAARQVIVTTEEDEMPYVLKGDMS